MENKAKKASNVMDLVAANERHWKLVGIELALTSGVRAACANVGIMQGKCTPKTLREFCVDELGEDTFGLVYNCLLYTAVRRLNTPECGTGSWTL